jgi:hypothetical protein
MTITHRLLSTRHDNHTPIALNVLSSQPTADHARIALYLAHS